MLKDVLKIPELRTKFIYFFSLIFVYRLGMSIPIPGIDIKGLRYIREIYPYLDQEGSYAGLLNVLCVFMGGDIGNASLFSLGFSTFVFSKAFVDLFSLMHPSYGSSDEVFKENVRIFKKFFAFVFTLIGAFFLIRFFSMPIHIEGKTIVLLKPQSYMMAYIAVVAGVYLLHFILMQLNEYGIVYGGGEQSLSAVNQLIFIIYILKTVESESYVFSIILICILILSCLLAQYSSHIYLTIATRVIRRQRRNQKQPKHIHIQPKIWITIESAIAIITLGIIGSHHIWASVYIFLAIGSFAIFIMIVTRSDLFAFESVVAFYGKIVFGMGSICYCFSITKAISLDFWGIIVMLFLLWQLSKSYISDHSIAYEIIMSLKEKDLYLPNATNDKEATEQIEKKSFIITKVNFLISLIILYFPICTLSIFGYSKMVESLGIQVIGVTAAACSLKIQCILKEIKGHLAMRNYSAFIK